MDITEAEKRSKAAFAIQDQWRDLLEVAYDYNIPERNNFTTKTQGAEEDEYIFDETAPEALPRSSNRLQRSIFPEAEEWVQFKSGVDIPKQERDRVDSGLEEYTGSFFAHFNATNFYTEVNPSIKDCLISTGVIQMDEEPVTNDQVATFANIPLNEIAFEAPVKGRLVNCWRKFKLEVGQVKTKWPKAKIPSKLEEMIVKDGNKKEEFMLGHVKKGSGFLVVILWKKAILLEESFGTQRIFAFRLNVFPGEVLGRGPGILLLPLLRDINTIKQLTLENAALNVAGMYTGVSDGIFNPYTFVLSPGGVIPVSSNATNNPSLKRLENSGDLGMGQLIVEDMRDAIRKAYFVDPLGDFSDPVRSATEQTMRMQEFLKDQGASISRLRTELVEPIVLSFIDVLSKRGKLPKVKVDGKEVKIIHNTQLVRAEKQDDFQALITLLSTVNEALGQEVMLATVQVEDLPAGMAKMLGVSSDFIRPQEQRNELISQVLGALNAQQGTEAGAGAPEAG